MPKRKRASFGRTLRAKRRLNQESSAEEDNSVGLDTVHNPSNTDIQPEEDTAENPAENDVLHGGRPNEENNVDPDPAQNPNNADTDSENIDNAHGVVLHDLPEAMSYDRDNFVTKATIGKLNVVCNFCRASTFQGERAGLCCNKGKIVLDSYPPPPEDIRYLYINSNTDAKHFLANIKRYNAAFQMTSLGCDEKKFAGWNPQFLIQGQLYHLHGSATPQENEQPRFLQIYFVDPEEQVELRNSIAGDLSSTVVEKLQTSLLTNNAYIQQFKTAAQIIKDQNIPDVSLVLKANNTPAGEHIRRYNVPTTSEVAILMPNDPIGERDIIIRCRGNTLQRISQLHQAYDPLQYPLLFPYGTHGWNLACKFERKVTQQQFYCYQLMIRP